MTGEELTEWRELRGLTRAALAELLGVGAWTIGRWETGKHRMPAGKMLERSLRDIDREVGFEDDPLVVVGE